MTESHQGFVNKNIQSYGLRLVAIEFLTQQEKLALYQAYYEVTPLRLLVELPCKEDVGELVLSAYADPVCYPRTPAMQAKIIECLIRKGDLLFQSHQEIAFYFSAQYGHLNVLECLLKRQFSQDLMGEAAQVAMRNGHVNLTWLLMDQNPIPQSAKDSLIIEASARGAIESVVYLAQHREFPERTKERAITEAAKNGHLAIVQYLIEKEVPSEKTKKCALKKAVEKGHIEVVRYLLETGSEISFESKEEVLRKAASHGQLDLVRYLVEKVALDSPFSKKFKEQAAKIAAIHGQVEVVKELLQVPEFFLQEREEYLHEALTKSMQQAAEEGLVEKMNDLLKRCEISSLDREECIYLAAGKGHIEMIRYLLKKHEISLLARGVAVSRA
ncbi:MAG: ankyrin repeat domain-containing protein, partial [Chlamydiia bacterium]|nr:ankyrin repeat domain-containing protein [Chlamydiia bacterium]